MTDVELEEEIFKYLQQGGQLVPASQMGIDTDDLLLAANMDKIYAAAVDLYSKTCQSLDSNKKEIEEYVAPEQLETIDVLAGFGQYHGIHWYSLSVYYDSSLYSIDDVKNMYNEHHNMTARDNFEGPMVHLATAINANDGLLNILDNPHVISTSRLFEMDEIDNNFQALTEYTMSLEQFIDQKIALGSYLTFDNNSISVKGDCDLRGKDVIVPFLVCNQNTLKLLLEAGKAVMSSGARTVIGLFVTRSVPSKDGREISHLPGNNKIQSFAPRFYF